jgi:hypothetical protein
MNYPHGKAVRRRLEEFRTGTGRYAGPPLEQKPTLVLVEQKKVPVKKAASSCRTRGVKSNTFSDEQIAEIGSEYCAGATLHALAAKHKCSDAPIKNALRLCGITPRVGGVTRKPIVVERINPYTGYLTLSNKQRIPAKLGDWTVGQEYTLRG